VQREPDWVTVYPSNPSCYQLIVVPTIVATKVHCEGGRRKRDRRDAQEDGEGCGGARSDQ
jgi:hypothetical protein